MSNSWSFCTPVTSAPARPAPHRPHAAGAHTTVSPGLATCRSVDDCEPGCFPRPRPLRWRSDRSPDFFLYGLSDDGGLDDVDESWPRRRSSSATRPLSAANRASAASRPASATASCASLASMISRSRALAARSAATSTGRSSPAGSAGRSATSHHDRTPRSSSSRHAGRRRVDLLEHGQRQRGQPAAERRQAPGSGMSGDRRRDGGQRQRRADNCGIPAPARRPQWTVLDGAPAPADLKVRRWPPRG
jgi:hypothetical protein